MENAAKALFNLSQGQKILRLLNILKLALFLWPSPATVKDNSSYDVIIVGGGTAGCVIASELAKMNVSVLLVEAGGDPSIATEFAGLFPFLRGSNMDWNFTSTFDHEAYKYHRGKVTEVQQGKVLGGSGQVNYLIYGKGSPKDYNKWAEITNDSSWQFKNLCNVFKRIEKVTDQKILQSPDIMFHGTEGKIKIKKYRTQENKDYFQSYRELGQNVVLDINPNNTLGYTNAYANIDCNFRQSTAYSYLSPEKDNPNLSVMYNALVTEIVFDEDKNAIGVKILTENATTITVKANIEIIVSAGVMKSPQLLMLSGVGMRSHLEEKEIEIISDLPVGQNLIDHPAAVMIYKMGKADPDIKVNPFEFPVSVMEGYVALKEDQYDPDYQTLSGVVSNPEFFLQACGSVFTFKNIICDFIAQAGIGRKLHFVVHSLLYPKSRGEVLLKNKDPKHDPIIDLGYYSDKSDLENHAKYLEHYNKVVNTTFFKSVGSELIYPEMKRCDKLKRGSKKSWKCYVKGMSNTLHMYYGTCAMGSVVDSKLRVIGVKKLRVADASVIPTTIGSTIHATTIMIAHKLVDIFKNDYKLAMK